MASIKCPHCGLVNFSTAANCKRCQTEFNDLSQLTAQRNYQKPSNNFQTFQMPPPPPVFHGGQPSPVRTPSLNCVTCGETGNTSLRDFKKDYVPPVAYLGIFIGLLPLAILVLILRTRYQITIPFCGECWKNYRFANILTTVSSIGFLFGLIFVIIIGIASESLFIFFLFLAGLSGLYYWGYAYTKKVSPKVTKINGKHLVITSPVVGEIYFPK